MNMVVDHEHSRWLESVTQCAQASLALFWAIVQGSCFLDPTNQKTNDEDGSWGAYYRFHRTSVAASNISHRSWNVDFPRARESCNFTMRVYLSQKPEHFQDAASHPSRA